ncbi:DUF1073 domain-containing protein [Paenibacillus filicis]|uniref:DUF1073 domain-containing protein n=1 Tax=Paenibacillus gyeongsangnamensis TaxID=3388067 RepID=A0ABT4QJ19_9BACL|nr:DUF1073 domain-containing protein [Paenibacillus filicis]MCZ8516839.1 DUF1073 domain-containing protein [Paenibacillus filicis]
MSRRNRSNRRSVQDARKTMPKPKPPKGMFTTDSFSNPIARMGFGTPNLLEGTNYVMTRATLNYNLMNTLYRSHWIVRRIIDTIPEDMTRNWITVNSQMDPEDIRKIDKAWKKNGLKSKILHGLKWGRLYGGAVGIIMIKGHEDILDQPLDFDTIMPGSFAGLTVVDRWSDAYPSLELVEDIDSTEFGLPLSYQVTLEGGKLIHVHHSRIIRFSGRKLPYWEELAEVHWGASEVEVVFDELKKRDNTSWNIAQLVFLANLRVMKIGDLSEVLAIGNAQAQQDLYNTLQMQNWLMSNMGIYVMGNQDGFETHQYTFSGLNDIYESFMMDVAGACQIPVTKLFGRSPAGLNATGDADMQNYYETIQESQETVLAPVLDKIIPIICMSEFGAIPDDIDYTFNPIRTPTDKETAELSAKKSEAILEAFNSGVISQKITLKELKALSTTTGMFTNITDEDI